MDVIKVTDGCGDLESSFSSEALGDVSFMSLQDGILTFAPTYESAISETGKSILSTTRPTKIPVKMTVTLPGYNRKAETEFEVVFAPTEAGDCSTDEITVSEAG